MKWFSYNVEVNIKLYYINILNKIIKWEKSIYIKKRHLYENKYLYLLSHAKFNRVILKKYNVKEKLVLLKM